MDETYSMDGAGDDEALPPEVERKLELVVRDFQQAEERLGLRKPQRPLYYYLDADGNPVGTTDPMAVEAMYRSFDQRITAKTYIEWKHYRAEVSTVFLGIDHSFTDEGPPVLWESMIFGNVPMDDYQWRYSSRDQAETGHRALVLSAMASLLTPTKRKRRLCERSGHVTPFMASDSASLCPRCGKVLTVGAICRRMTQFDREETVPPKIRRRRHNHRRNVLKNFRKTYMKKRLR